MKMKVENKAATERLRISSSASPYTTANKRMLIRNERMAASGRIWLIFAARNATMGYSPNSTG